MAENIARRRCGRALKCLSWGVPLSILVIFWLLFNAFRGLRAALLVIAKALFAMIGNPLSVWRQSASWRCWVRRCSTAW